jgi:DNA-binding NarL/FixJ family response regulator
MPFSAVLIFRQHQIPKLIAIGFTDAEVAAALFVSRRTVYADARSIYSKLGVRTRLAATRDAVDHGLV